MNLEAALAAVAEQHIDVVAGRIRQQPDVEKLVTEIVNKETWAFLRIFEDDHALAIEVGLAGATNRAIPLNDIPDDMSAALAALLQEGAS